MHIAFDFSAIRKQLLLTVLLLSATAISSCQAPTDKVSEVKIDAKHGDKKPYPDIFTLFACKSNTAAFVGAHRGTHKGSNFPENTLQSLQELHAKGVPFAVVDIAALKDGKHILWHDALWTRHSQGKDLGASGPLQILEKPLVDTSWAESQTLLVKDTKGDLTSYRPSALTDVLAWAKDKIYLEISFKSNADQDVVIAEIRDADMLGQVILISYDAEQALALHKAAPTAALSVPIFKPSDIKALEVQGIPANVMTAWTGPDLLTTKLATALRAKKIPILTPSFYGLDDKLQKSGSFQDYVSFAIMPDLVVSDFAFDANAALGAETKDCIKG